MSTPIHEILQALQSELKGMSPWGQAVYLSHDVTFVPAWRRVPFLTVAFGGVTRAVGNDEQSDSLWNFSIGYYYDLMSHEFVGIGQNNKPGIFAAYFSVEEKLNRSTLDGLVDYVWCTRHEPLEGVALPQSEGGGQAATAMRGITRLQIDGFQEG